MKLVVQDISVSYSKREVLHNISLSPLQAGSFVGLLGPNGSGKSTLLKSLVGLVKTSKGYVHLNNKEVKFLKGYERAMLIAYMPQVFHSNALLTVFESVLLALKQNKFWRSKEEVSRQVTETLEKLQLTSLADRYIAHLSGGQAQMTAVAQTLVRCPKIVLLDEPTSALDLHHQLSILNTVKQDMKKRNTLVIAALHDLNLAAKFCDQLILLEQGSLSAQGQTTEVLSLPEIDKTYRVKTYLEETQRGSIYVDSHL